MLENIKKYVILEPHIDDFELGCLPLILKNTKPFTDEQTPVAEVHILSFCLGRNVENWFMRSKARTKIIELLEKRGIKVEWRNMPTSKYDTELNDSLIPYHCEYVNFYIKPLLTEEFIFLIPQVDLHPDHNHANHVGKIISRKLRNIPILEYIVWNSKDNSNIITTSWNIDIGEETKTEDIIFLDNISEIFEGEFYKLHKVIYNKKYNLIKYDI